MYMSETSKKKYDELKEILLKAHDGNTKFGDKMKLVSLIDSIDTDETETLEESLDVLHYIVITLLQTVSVNGDLLGRAHRHSTALGDHVKSSGMRIAELEKQMIDLSGNDLSIH